jgi:hypothetical protein
MTHAYDIDCEEWVTVVRMGNVAKSHLRFPPKPLSSRCKVVPTSPQLKAFQFI